MNILTTSNTGLPESLYHLPESGKGLPEACELPESLYRLPKSGKGLPEACGLPTSPYALA